MLHAGQYGLGAGLRSRVLPDERGRQQAALLIVDPGQREWSLRPVFDVRLPCISRSSFRGSPGRFFVDTWQLLARTIRRGTEPTGPPVHAGRVLLRRVPIAL